MSAETVEAADRNGSAAARAGGSSFYFAMRILPRAQREAMFEVYSFCKAVDDIADGDAPRPERLRRLAGWRRDIAALYAGRIPAGLANLAHAVNRFSLREEDFLAVIEGMEMDSAEDIRAPDLEWLDFYCDRVACAVGRLSVRIFGMDEENGKLLAHHLGSALQLTNILRDLDEDAAVGRLYLPQEALRLAGIHTTDPQAAIASPDIGIACDFVVARARNHFMKADEILSRFPRRIARVPRIMEKAYQRTLDNMIARGWARPRDRVRLSRSQLLGIALRHAIV
ncbi:MAG TPA: presqualene diphosphate synthase HpnD [Xanthobacteraceae bacterium]|nr:presqualene diphosphate synthase HpnD [Xanthobacteraceae bacterium]